METGKVREFLRYVDKEILPATTDLENLDVKNRKHVQKLVYTNLVDRFDSLIDGLVLDNCRCEFLTAEATKGMTQQITEAELIKLLMRSGDIQDAIDEKLKAAIRNSVLRERHSKKLTSALSAFEVIGNLKSAPRVNVSTGAILEKITPQNKYIPYSIAGYADWLYSRRNAIVHGNGSNKYLKNDLVQLKKLYKCEPTETFRIKLGTVQIAAEFYRGVCGLFTDAANEA
ncbi:MAG: hypothetical protein CVV10_08385 [Gammaproteobacteria bacterium HGW-Gammaproteobacteria-14]|nr:MAG: hypothetical protein CVV10_08385 [Gammaproteobacteria bacterium HGW-Gammaproteobacteria-14]